MTDGLTVEFDVDFSSGGSTTTGTPGAPSPGLSPGRVPRVARLMALAIRFERLIRERVVADYAELARLGHVSRARVTQIMNLLILAPDIQEQILFLPLTTEGRDPIREHDLRPIAAEPDWAKQQAGWGKLVRNRDRQFSCAKGS